MAADRGENRALQGLHWSHDAFHFALGNYTLPGPADFLSINSLDAREQRRLGGDSLSVPSVARLRDLADGLARPDSAWFVDVAYFPGAAALARLRDRYSVSPPDSLWVGDYGVGVRRLVRRPAPALGAAR